MANASIVLLVFSSSPTAVLGRILAVIINAVNGHLIRWHPHIIGKIVKGVPSFANPYPPTAVIRPTLVIGFIATLVHRLPSIVQFFLVCSMYLSYPLRRVMFGTTATGAIARNKMPSNNSASIATIAHTFPKPSFIRSLPNIGDSNKFTETSLDKINTVPHNCSLP